MQTVYILYHVHELNELDEDEKLIGIYASRADADAAIERAKLLPGFKECPDGFSIGEYVLGQDQWVEGFFTWDPRTDDGDGGNSKADSESSSKGLK